MLVGSVHAYDLAHGERRSVDNGHVVAWTASMPYEVAMATGSIFTSMTSGEGMMCHFTGPGTVYVQSHQEPVVVGKNGIWLTHFVCAFPTVLLNPCPSTPIPFHHLGEFFHAQAY